MLQLGQQLQKSDTWPAAPVMTTLTGSDIFNVWLLLEKKKSKQVLKLCLDSALKI